MRKTLARTLCSYFSLLTVATTISVASQNVKAAPQTNSENQSTQNSQSAAGQSCEEVRSNLQRLNQEMARLRRRLAELEKDRQINTIQDMLTKE